MVTQSKKAVGELAAQLIEPGMRVGLGTGSTATFFIKALGKRVKEGLKVVCAASSDTSLALARSLSIPLIQDEEIEELDVTVDGADEIDPNKNMIKGGGGALFREKILAFASKEMIVIIDDSKWVERLGSFPLPVEVSSFGIASTLKALKAYAPDGMLRKKKDGALFITDNQNYIFDFSPSPSIPLNEDFEHKLKKIPGVIETGLFLGYAGRVIVGFEDRQPEIR